MIRAVCALAVLVLAVLAAFGAFAEELEPAQSIAGEIMSREDGALLRLSYAYPQFAAQTDADEAINAFYRALADDAASAALNDGEEWAYEPCCTRIDHRISRNDERYLSIVFSSLSMRGGMETETISADTFARDGMYAGQPLSLTQVLGLEREYGASEDERSIAERTVLKLVWQITEAARRDADSGYPEGITESGLEAVFTPETDFYLDEDGNIVFFIQAGELAGDIAGVLYFPFAPAELLSELN